MAENAVIFLFVSFMADHEIVFLVAILFMTENKKSMIFIWPLKLMQVIDGFCDGVYHSRGVMPRCSCSTAWEPRGALSSQCPAITSLTTTSTGTARLS